MTPDSVTDLYSALIDALHNHDEHHISAAEYYLLLHNSPIVCGQFSWAAQDWHFGITSPNDAVIAVRDLDDSAGYIGPNYIIRLTPFINPYECGHSIIDQLKLPRLIENYGRFRQQREMYRQFPHWTGLAVRELSKSRDTAHLQPSFHQCHDIVSAYNHLQQFDALTVGSAITAGDICLLLTRRGTTPVQSDWCIMIDTALKPLSSNCLHSLDLLQLEIDYHCKGTRDARTHTAAYLGTAISSAIRSIR